MADNDITNRLALITGASSGYVVTTLLPIPPLILSQSHTPTNNNPPLSRIGAACARDLASKGCHLALTYSKNLTSMEQVVESIRESSPEAEKLRISIHKVDVGVVDDITDLFTEIEQEHKGRCVDILVSNAGYGKRIVDVWYVCV